MYLSKKSVNNNNAITHEVFDYLPPNKRVKPTPFDASIIALLLADLKLLKFHELK